MFRFAALNILTRPLRSLLALVGVSVSIAGVVGLISVSGGLRGMMTDTLAKVEGLVMIEANSVDPIFSTLPVAYAKRVEAIPGVQACVPELWRVAPNVEGGKTLVGLFNAVVVLGLDPERHTRLSAGHVYSRSMRRGRNVEVRDRGTRNVVISERLARKYAKDVGGSIRIGEEQFPIVGVYDTGSLFLDGTIIMHLEEATRVAGFQKELVTSFYVEAVSRDPAELARIEKAIEAEFANEPKKVDCLSTTEWQTEFGAMLRNLDVFLLVVSSIAVFVGAIGVLNTMLMSVTERVPEFGILKANGWSRWDVTRLVLIESALLGVIGGAAGCGLGVLGVTVAGRFMPFAPQASPALLLGAFSTGVVLGILGGVYPAHRAAGLHPVEAIRAG
ncbi:MAG: ABC transporter permease [Candidatus Brocadiae bacterium]|nr:ABC transporter permease [Candidatus Brocadiia bacterium]